MWRRKLVQVTAGRKVVTLEANNGKIDCMDNLNLQVSFRGTQEHTLELSIPTAFKEYA